jgi:exonuclease VII small subunit
MRMSKSIMLIVPLGAVLTLLGPVHAQRGTGPCREDIQKFCPGIKPGRGAMRDCLEKHASELSAACQEHLKQAKARMAQWRAACHDDVQKFCSAVTPGRGSIVRCLQEHHDQLSKSCQEQLAQARTRRRQRQGPPATPASPPSTK